MYLKPKRKPHFRLEEEKIFFNDFILLILTASRRDAERDLIKFINNLNNFIQLIILKLWKVWKTKMSFAK